MLTIALGMGLAVILTDSTRLSSTPLGSTPTEKNDTHKTGPWIYELYGTRV